VSAETPIPIVLHPSFIELLAFPTEPIDTDEFGQQILQQLQTARRTTMSTSAFA
jgi:hypothetical protein